MKKTKHIITSFLLLFLVTYLSAQEGFELNVLPATATDIQWYVNKQGGDSFAPISGATGHTYLVNSQGMYYATFTDNNCKNASAYFIFIEKGKPDAVYQYPFELNSFSGADSYQWFNGNESIGQATAQKYSVTQDGDYHVAVQQGTCRMYSAHFITRSVAEYVNQPPTAVADMVNVKANSSKDIFVLDNDSDPDGDALVKTSIVKQPNHGVIVENSVGNYTYTPRENYVGLDTVTYKVCDTFGACSESQIIIKVSCLDIQKLVIPQFISPNADGYNDFWKISQLLSDASCGGNEIRVKLFNRWGTEVWSSSSLNKESYFKGKGDGKGLYLQSSNRLPSGTYLYIIEMVGEDNVRSGYIYIAGTK